MGAKGCTIRSIWECELRAQMKADPEMKQFIDSVQLHDPLDPREAFFGGRTNLIRMLYKCRPGELMEYLDFTSLYPFICKYGSFPNG